MADTSMPIWGVLKVYAADGEKFTRVPLNCAEYTIGSDRSATIIVRRHNVDPIHCIVQIQSNGLALLKNKSVINPVPINGRSVPKAMYLLPGDTFSVVGKRFLYNNEHLKPEVLQEARKKNMESARKMKRPTMGRKLLTPQPEKIKVYKARRSASMDNLSKTSEKGRKLLAGKGRFAWVQTSVTRSSLQPSKDTSSDGFTVSTPKSAVKPTAPSLRNTAIFKNLAEMNFAEPECDSSSAHGSDRSEVLKTPVAEIVTEDNDVSTPLNNTSVVSIAMPIDDEVTPLRSRKSKAKDISIQRLTQNDESIIVLDTPDSKTPKSALKTTSEKGSFANINKTKLIDEYSDCGSPKNDDETNENEIDSVMDSSVNEVEEVEADSSVNESAVTESSDDLKLSRKASTSFVIEDIQDSDDLSTKVDCDDFVIETAPVSSTPAQKCKSSKKLVESFKQLEDSEEFGEEMEETEEDASCSQMDQSTSTDYNYGEKRKRGRYTPTEENSMKRSKFAESEESTEIESEISLDESLTKTPQPAKLPARKAMTEPKQVKKIIHRRSLSDRISNQENEPVMESANTTCETVDTSSFVYLKNNVTFENSDFGTPVSQSEAKPDTGKKGQKEPLNDLTDVAGIKKLMQTPRVGKEPLNDLSSPTGAQRLKKTPKAQKDDADDLSMSGIKTLMKTPAVERANSAEEDKSEEGTTSSVFNVSGISTLNDEDEDIFPKQKVRRTYGKSLPAKSKDIAKEASRKTEGCFAEVSPEVEKWVAKNTENLSNHNITDIDYDAADDESLTEDSEVPAVDTKAGENDTGKRNRGRSLPPSGVNKTNKKARHTEGALPESIQGNDDEEVETARVSLVVSRKSIRKSMVIKNEEEPVDGQNLESNEEEIPEKNAEEIDHDESMKDENIGTEYLSEDPVVPSRKSVKKSIKTVETTETEEILDKDIDDETKSTRKSVKKATTHQEIRISNEDVTVDDVKSDNDEHTLEEPVISLRKSVRKSLKEMEMFTLDEDISDSEEVEVSRPQSVVVSWQTTRRSQANSKHRENLRKSPTNLESADLEESDEGIDSIQKPVISSRKSSRKSEANKQAIDERTEEIATTISDNEKEEVVEEPIVPSRKSIRKSGGRTQSVDEFEIIAPSDDEPSKKTPELSRNSITKSLKNVDAVGLEMLQEPHVSSSKYERKPSKDFESIEHDESNTEDITDFNLALSSDEMSYSQSRISENDESMEEDVVEDNKNEETVEAPTISSRKSTRKSTKDAEAAEDDNAGVVEKPSSSLKSTRKSRVLLFQNEVPVAPPRKSVRRTINQIETEHDKSTEEVIVEIPVAVSRKTSRKSLAKMESPENDSENALEKDIATAHHVVDNVEMETEEMPKPLVSVKKSSRKSLAQPLDEPVSEEPFSSKKIARKSLKNTDSGEIVESGEDAAVTDGARSSRKSVRKSLKSMETPPVTIVDDSNKIEAIDSSRKSSRKSLAKPVDEHEFEELSTQKKSARKSMKNITRIDNEEKIVENVEDSQSSRKSVRKSLQLMETAIVDIEDNEVEKIVNVPIISTASRKSARKSMTNDSTPVTTSNIELPSATRKSLQKSTSNDEHTTLTPASASRSRRSTSRSSTVQNVTNDIIDDAVIAIETFVTPVKSTSSKDDTVFKTPQLLSKTPKSSKKSTKKRNIAETKLTYVDENDKSKHEVIPAEEPQGRRKSKRARVQKEPENDLSSPRGVKQLMATPKVGKEPKNDLTSPKGVKQLMATPKVVKEPKNDLSDLRGVKQLLATPKTVKEPKNDLSNPRGIKQLMATPKVVKGPKNDLSSPKGLKRLMRTPKEQKGPKNDLSDIEGVAELMATDAVEEDETIAPATVEPSPKKTTRATIEKVSEKHSRRNAVVMDNVSEKVVFEETPKAETEPKRESDLESTTRSGRSRRNAPKQDKVVEDTPTQGAKPKRGATTESVTKSGRSRRNAPKEGKSIEETPTEESNPERVATSEARKTAKRGKVDSTENAFGDTNLVNDTPKPDPKERKPNTSKGRTAKLNEIEDVEEDETSQKTKSMRATKTPSDDRKPAAIRKRGGKSVPEMEENAEEESEQDNDTKRAGRGRRRKVVEEVEVLPREPEQTTEKPKSTRSRRGKAAVVDSEITTSPEIDPVKPAARPTRKKTVEVESEDVQEVQPPKDANKARRGQKSESEVVEVKMSTRSRRGQHAVEVEDVGFIDDEDAEVEQLPEKKKTTRGQKFEPEAIERKTKTRSRPRQKTVEVAHEASDTMTTRRQKSEPEVEAKMTTRGRRGQKAVEVEDEETDVEQPPEEKSTRRQKSEPEVVEIKTRGRGRPRLETVEVNDVERLQDEKVKTSGEKSEPEVVKAKTKTRSRRGQKAVEVENVLVDDEEADAEQQEEDEKPTRTRRGAASKSVTKATRGRATKAVEQEIEPTETQIEKSTRARRGRKATIEADEEDAIVDQGANKKATKAAPKRGGPAKQKVNTSPEEGKEIEVEVVRTKSSKGVTTITVEKKVSFEDENRRGALLITPQPKVSKRRLKSDAEMNDSDLQPTVKRTRARK